MKQLFKKINFKRKISTKVGVLVIVLFSISVSLLAHLVPTDPHHWYHGWRVWNHATKEIEYSSAKICKKVINNSGADYFVPTKTAAEWDNFDSHLPTNVSTNSCETCIDVKPTGGTSCSSGGYNHRAVMVLAKNGHNYAKDGGRCRRGVSCTAYNCWVKDNFVFNNPKAAGNHIIKLHVARDDDQTHEDFKARINGSGSWSTDYDSSAKTGVTVFSLGTRSLNAGNNTLNLEHLYTNTNGGANAQSINIEYICIE